MTTQDKTFDRDRWLLKLRTLMHDVITHGESADAQWCLSHYDIERRALDRMQWRGQADAVKEPQLMVACGGNWPVGGGLTCNAWGTEWANHGCKRPQSHKGNCICGCGEVKRT